MSTTRKVKIARSPKRGFLDGKMLIAMPSMRDERFAQSVIYVCAHSSDGAMGIVVNRVAAEIDFPKLLVKLDVIPREDRIQLPDDARMVQVLKGGPVETQRGFVLHYRAAPAAGPEIGRRLAELVAQQAASFELMPASMAWEIRPRGADKGHAVRELMRLPPFAGRRPIFIGDDVTDEDGIREARALGGEGYRVPEVFGDAAGVRAWLARMVEDAS